MDAERTRLLTAVREGDPLALGQLLELYRPYLLLIARVQIGKRFQAKLDETDLVQETFLEAHRQFPNFRGTSEPELTSWLRRILAGQIALMLRRYLNTKGRDLALERQLVQELDQSSQMMDGGLAGSGTSPSMQVSRREQSVLLAEALQKLPADYQEVIVLRNLEQLPFSEVAAKMNRTEDAVQKLWMRALKGLRQALGGTQ